MEWKINKGSHECIMCNKMFCEEEEYYSSIFEENSMFVRKDFCIPCWGKDKEGAMFSFWKTKIPKKDKPVQRFANTEIFLDMFARLEGGCEAHQKNLRYVLALYLIRKKIFRLKSLTRQNGEEYIILYYPKEDRELNVFNPNLKEAEIETITTEMNQLLNYPYATHICT